MNSLVRLYVKSKKSNISFIIVIIKHIYYRIQGKYIFASKSSIITGVKNIKTFSKLQMGIEEVAFMLSSDKTYLNIRGICSFKEITKSIDEQNVLIAGNPAKKS